MQYKKWNAILRLKYGIQDPDKLSTEEWAKLVEEYRYVHELEQRNLQVQRELLEYNMKKTIYEVVHALYGKK